ncbi:hypothetical protein [Bacillus pseudomycoides]|uniref:hypothetical protein n=1 Tax=Bacillus pseudomycoides TaxID=64104 RepID=UPI000BECCE28|nr:hypothetical protein [Bacillus pseudomycoides]PEE36712.1 hypothetical protein COO02_25620 [Bacillus pseudomycoides]PEI96411.1 hypothetical protein CN679_01355 [Bacillus pseudomycoides]PGA91135.1 hypothetical protein COL91_11385 [Bacillus pseudomycoides]PHF31344.1 hypothetical protein COF72_28030 [Bacillus pseudomycoides]
MFGSTENALFNQLYAAFLAYIVLKTLHEKRHQYPLIQGTSIVRFTRQLLETEPGVEWQLIFQTFLRNYKRLYGCDLSETG